MTGCTLKTACDVARGNSRATGQPWGVFRIAPGDRGYSAGMIVEGDKFLHVFRDGKHVKRFGGKVLHG